MKNLKDRYLLNKSKNIGEEIKCKVCNKVFTKKTKQQAFCGGRGDTRCKDKYWNTVDSSKRNNTTRISPASKRWMSKQNYNRDNDWEYDDDPSWDAHKGSF